MKYLYINKEWIVSDTAKQIYWFAAIWSLVLFVLLIWAGLSELPGFMASIFQPLAFIGVLGAATTWVAMEYFLFGFDRSPAWKKTLWFLVMCLPPIGPALYCLTVYRKADAADCSKPQRAEDVIF
jgi:hypothetical protein